MTVLRAVRTARKSVSGFSEALICPKKEGSLSVNSKNMMSVVVPVGAESEKTHRVIELNETAARIYDGIEKGLDERTIAGTLE